MRFRRNVGRGYGSYWRGIIFDREYKNLDDLVVKSHRWFLAFEDGARFLSAAKDYKWIWPTGEELLFRAIKTEQEYDNYHGHEYPYIGWNELAKYPNSNIYDRMMSVNRSSFIPPKGSNIPPIPLEVFSTTNPYGVGHGWIKRRFIDPAPYGQVIRNTIDVFNPRTQQRELVTKTQVTIFGTYKENIYLPPEYIAELESISDPNLKAAWLWGDWDIVAGGALSDLWRKDIHVIPDFRIPKEWYVDRCFDWGSSHPFYCGWFAEANGETVETPKGPFTPQPGSLILISEWYGTKEIGTNVGLKLSAGDIAQGIKLREGVMLLNKQIPYRPWPGAADNQIRDVREMDVDTIEKKMADFGIHWLESDKSPGSRKNGLQLTRDRLEAAVKKEGPALYFMESCRGAIGTIPTLPRDEVKIDDVDTEAEDHPYDATRYRVLHGNNRLATKIRTRFWT